MNIGSGLGVNRFTGQGVMGDEPTILGVMTYASPSTTEDCIEDPIPINDETFLAALPVRAALVEVLDDWAERLNRGISRNELRLAIGHVSRDTGGLYDLNPFEASLLEEIDQLVWICVQPLQDLRYDEVIQPVGRVRRPARSAAQQLSAHSEQWERWNPDFPLPKEILASIREDDIDLYENRVVRTLVNGATLHLSRRLQKLRSHLTKNIQGRHVLLTGWHWRQERLRAAFDAQDVDTVIEMLELAVKELEEMSARLAVLERSPLFQGTVTRSRVHSLRITNVLRRDPRYRRIPPLWKHWRSAQDDDALVRKRLDDPYLCQLGMDVLTEILTAKALDWLGYKFDSSTGNYRKGHATITFEIQDGVSKLLVVDLAGSREIRLVGLASPLRSGDQPDPLRNARLFETWLQSQSVNIGALAVLHPVDDFASIGYRERTLIDHTGIDAVDPLRTWAVIPATPLLVDSLERVTRFLRWHLIAPVYLTNTIRISCGELNRNDRQALDELDACRLEGRELVVLQPLKMIEKQLLDAMAARRPVGWHEEIARAGALHDVLLQCPIYPTHEQSDTNLERRDNGTFLCKCKRCRAEWGTNICGSCGSSIPFIRPGKAVPDGQTPNDFFGGDLLSSLCEGAMTADVEPVQGGPDLRVLICPHCRKCPRSSRYPDCKRCGDDAN
jgi:hypothetical protein